MKRDESKTKEQSINETMETGFNIFDLGEYQALFEQSPLGITVLDKKGVIKECNSVVYSKSGYSKDDYIGKHFSQISTIQARDIPRFIKVYQGIRFPYKRKSTQAFRG